MRHATCLNCLFGLALLLSASSSYAAPRTSVDTASDSEIGCADASSTGTDRAREAAESRSKPTASRPSRHSATRSATSNTSRGGGDDATPARSQGAKWHSFLPGMFR